VHGIVSQNHGHIDVQSEPGTKTTFSIYLPRAAPDADTEPVAAAAGELPRGTETILLAEDERSVRVTAQLLLEALGYTVLAAGTPGEAMRLADAHSGPICLLITDVIMPSLNGPHLAGALADERPGLKCLFISGYTADVMVQRGTLSAGMPFLAKPFTRADLAHRVREVLDAPAPGRSLPG
jgi:CheY-like chemotaxis protein